ncbi:MULTISPECIES: MDR family MFS transporter [Lactobacillaceae]|uniref:MDR family MFS transporter n=1 Tax=Lactobacillaceae TaxID=33958 RepID=UPI00145774CB|nr:MDR family MFS transporter [Lactobacillus sp. HBUAS51381]NLR09765.1 multidrug efflux MFS transporter [Lactobacillus sp. HBUAS51381]
MSAQKSQQNIIQIALFLVIGAIAPLLDTTMTNVALDTIMRSLNVSVNAVQWVTTSYVLALGITVPVTGWATNWFDGKHLYLGALLVFLLGSLLSGWATTLPMLIAGRIVQGAAAGMIVPLITTLVVQVTGSTGLGKLMAVVGMPAVLIPILGPTVGGYLIQVLNWHWIFFINIPLVLLALMLLGWKLPAFPAPKHGKHLDIPSLVLLADLFTFAIIGITRFSTGNQLTSLTVLTPLLVALACLIFYVLYASWQPDKALVSLTLFRSPTFDASLIILMLSGIAVNGAMFLLPLYLQNTRGLSVVWSGTYLIAQGVGLLVSRSQIGRLTDSIGARWVVLVSIGIAVAGTLPFVYFSANTSLWWVLLALFIRGIGQGGLTIPVMADSYTGLPQSRIAEATTATRMLQNIGGAMGTAVLATIIQHALPHVGMNAAYQTAFLWSIGFILLTAIPAWFLSHPVTVKA